MGQPAFSTASEPEEVAPLRAVRDAPVGGQAVLEGVMMRGVSTWAVAVRKPDGEVAISSEPLVSWAKRNRVLRWPVEGVLRTAIFIGYLVLISRIADLRRVFEYHGAEHKTISCYEAGDRLTPERAERYSRLHPRCGTSFLLVVMVVAIFVFAPLGLPAWYWLLASRILGIPLIAGISYEVIKWAGRNRRKRWVRAVMYPGLMLQNLTTREPDREQLAVAIAALESVLAVENPEQAAGAEGRIEIVA